jgi:hypothetical protein
LAAATGSLVPKTQHVKYLGAVLAIESG